MYENRDGAGEFGDSAGALLLSVVMPRPSSDLRLHLLIVLSRVQAFVSFAGAATEEWFTQRHEDHQEERCRIGDSREKYPRLF
jgi:hypothetical protein